MKTNLIGIVITLVMILVGLAIIIPSVEAGYDDESWTGADPIDALMPVPAATMRQFGSKGGTDKVRLCYNIAELLKAANAQEVRIKSLEKRVEVLLERVDAVTALTNMSQGNATDPNEVTNGS